MSGDELLFKGFDGSEEQLDALLHPSREAGCHLLLRFLLCALLGVGAGILNTSIALNEAWPNNRVEEFHNHTS